MRLTSAVVRLCSIAAILAGGAQAADLTLRPSSVIEPTPALNYNFYVHAGIAGLILNEGASMTAGGAPLPGATIAIRSKPHYTFAAEAGYFFTPNIAVSFTGGFPPTVDIKGAGTVAALGRMGKATYGPMTLTAHYHFTQLGRFQPYIGAGPTFMYVFQTKDDVLTQLKIDHAVGFAVQAGADYMINDQWGVFFDVKKAYLRTTATASLGGAPIRAKVRLDPLVLHTGVTYRF